MDLCFPFVLGKYLDVEWLGYMHTALHPVPSWSALEAPSLFSHPLIPVLKFCCPALLWVTTTRVSASGLRSVGLPRLLLRSILFSIPRACVFPTFPKIPWTPSSREAGGPHNLLLSGRTAVPQKWWGERGWMLQAETPDPKAQ